MTSEIIIMNTDVIALAADSTITINDKKTYNGVNKIFMLSNDPPMGIMVFGLGKFENISIETLIKEYSKKTNFKKLKNIINIKIINNLVSEDCQKYLVGKGSAKVKLHRGTGGYSWVSENNYDVDSDEYKELKKELFLNQDYVEYQHLENEIHLLILEMNQRLKKLTSERKCHHENY